MDLLVRIFSTILSLIHCAKKCWLIMQSQLSCKRFYFQHDGAGPHYAVIVRKWPDEKFSDQ
jgi:hypothetical protein